MAQLRQRDPREQVKFTLSGNKMIMLHDDNKQQKATIVKSSLTQSH